MLRAALAFSRESQICDNVLLTMRYFPLHPLEMFASLWRNRELVTASVRPMCISLSRPPVTVT